MKGESKVTGQQSEIRWVFFPHPADEAHKDEHVVVVPGGTKKDHLQIVKCDGTVKGTQG